LESGLIHEVHEAKVNAVRADLEEIIESGEKAVIFHRFRWESRRYQDLVRSLGLRAFTISGDTPVADRADSIREFRDWGDSCVAVVQTQSGGVGISFATATHALFVSRGFSFVDDEQARDRIYARGAARCVTYYEAANTVDGFVAKVLAAKGNVHEALRNADRASMVYA
jgi:SNF2 family DNA or RNA helicase